MAQTEVVNKKSRSQRLQKIVERHRLRAEAKKARRLRRKEYKEAEARGEVVEKQIPDTVESKRVLDDDVVDEACAEFEEVLEAEADDEFAAFYRGEVPPKILMTTIDRPGKHILKFLKELQVVLPESYYIPRNQCESAEELLKFALSRNFTDVIIMEIRQSRPFGMFITHLPDGPTTHFRISGLQLAEEMGTAVQSTTHRPELVMKNFSTAVSRRVQRQLQALFPFQAEFEGRRVVAFINKHDFIFFRHYRYVFKAEGSKAGLAEIGPKFTLKLRSVQQGILDRECGVYEFHWRPKLQETHKQHYL